MNLINNIKNIKKFIVYKNKILTINNNNVFSDQAKNIQLFDSPVNGFIQFNNKIYINDWSGKYFILDANLNILENGDGKGFYFSSSNYFGCQYLNEFGLNEALIDKNSKAIEFGILNKDSSLNYSTQSFFFFIKENYLHSYSLPSATPLWQFDLGSLGEYETYKGEVKSYSVEKFIGVWKDELLVACSNSLIISFDVNTGVEKRRWQTLENYYPNVKEVANKLPRTENFVLDTYTNTLIGLHIFSLVKIDLKTGIIEVVNMENELRKYHINLLKNNSSYAIDDSHIYTTATMDYEDNKSQWTYDCIIAINRETYQVDWQYKFENEGLGTNTPQLADNKLYQLTSSNMLFIFEKE